MALEARFQEVFRRIEHACHAANRDPATLQIVAVSKLQPVSAMLDYLIFSGKRGIRCIFGENYVQEFKEKREKLSDAFESHMIGSLQSNKAKEAVGLFDLIESIHSLKIAREVGKSAEKIGKVQSVYLQINVSNDPAKSGFTPDQLDHAVIDELAGVSGINICGVMTITALYDDPNDARGDFKALVRTARELEDRLGRKLTVSMGMSSDFEVAIAEGADVIRVGTALFGER